MQPATEGSIHTQWVVGFVRRKGKGGEIVKRMLLVLTVALVMVAIVVATAATSFAAKPGNCFHTGGGPPHGCGVQSNGSKHS